MGIREKGRRVSVYIYGLFFSLREEAQERGRGREGENP